MRRNRARSARAVAALTTLLGAVEAGLLLRPAAGPWGSVPVVALGLLAVPTVLALWCRGCFEAYLVAVLLAVAGGLGGALAMLSGLPGGEPTGLTPGGAAIVLLAVAVLVTVGRTSRRKAVLNAADPYA